MTITLEGGITFFGIIITPYVNTAAWFGGGYGPLSTVQRITYATDTATASVRGPLSVARYGLAAAGNTTDGWFGGGWDGGTLYATVNRITYATDTATASVRGPLSLARAYLAATGNTTDGWFGGGWGTPSIVPVSTVDRITYATDTATASVRGPLSVARQKLAAVGNSDYGWFGGGDPGWRSTVDRITYATDTATASVRGSLSAGGYGLAAAGNTTDGWFGGGYSAFYYPNPQSTVERITYATDTATASVRGPLSAGKYMLAAAGNATDGWFGGGRLASFAAISTVNRITYATDTATAAVRGPLSLDTRNLAAASGVQ
jgi:hypothetical protein